MKLGIGCAGVVVATGSGVTAFRPGDAVYGAAFGRPMRFADPPGFCAEYCVARESLLLPMPAAGAGVSFEEAATLLGFGVMAHESIELGLRHMAERRGGGGGLEGATVLVPAALSATGSVAVQMLKNVYGVSKVIGTVSTPKLPLVERYLPGLVDQVVDYKTTKNLTDVVEPGSVDFAYNTQIGSFTSIVPLMKHDTGVIVSIASVFPKEVLRKAMGDVMPFWLGWVSDLAQCYYRWLLWGTNVKLDFVPGNVGSREDLERTGEIIALGKVKAVMRVVELDDIEAIRKGCNEVYTGKGGVGALVIKFI
jgi:NADPH:quinone reductase-like Zn-dependent oxidoreductase